MPPNWPIVRCLARPSQLLPTSTPKHSRETKNNTTTILDNAVKTGKLKNSLSLQIFSAYDSKPLFEHYYTAPEVRNATRGVRKVDEDTVFRIGSGSKLRTMLLYMIETNGTRLDEPVAKYVPELKKAADKLGHSKMEQADEADYVQWDQGTIGELASDLADGFGDQAANPKTLYQLQQQGFPSLKKDDIPPCGAEVVCDRKGFFKGLLKGHPLASTSSTPIYSNAGFQILAYALEGITGNSYGHLL
ncbi:beta-lactamase [Penicillium alfredii]|uniref:Beta-lactamase n=1 Tax=Penicillium alfredii TaxID=1506179 RepID=A0A9W9ESA0_9EURO|nr:beta-lactamase [Penicillium alfredii]KAJ5087063.1 beta-lactamase [Penicillium alfredii]